MQTRSNTSAALVIRSRRAVVCEVGTPRIAFQKSVIFLRLLRAFDLPENALDLLESIRAGDMEITVRNMDVLQASLHIKNFAEIGGCLQSLDGAPFVVPGESALIKQEFDGYLNNDPFWDELAKAIERIDPSYIIAGWKGPLP